MKKEKLVSTEDGIIYYTIYVCDWCGRSGTERDFHRIYLESFFHEYNYLFRLSQILASDEKPVNDENIKKMACSTQCLESLMKLAMSDFYRAWNHLNKKDSIATGS